MSGPNKRAGETGNNIFPTGVWTHEARAIFLEQLSLTGRKADSARAAGVSRQTVLNHEKLDPTLTDEIEEALEFYKDSIRAEIHRRAVTGVDEPVFYQGVVCGAVTKYSDRMLELEAKRLMPEYREKSQVDVNHKGGVLVVPQSPAEEAVDKWAERANSKLN
jgi:hypothetical protein